MKKFPEDCIHVCVQSNRNTNAHHRDKCCELKGDRVR